MQKISLIFFNPLYILNKVCFKIHKNNIDLEKSDNISLYKMLSSCFSLKSYKSLTLFSIFNEHKNSNTNGNKSFNYDYYNDSYDDIDNTYILNIYRDIDENENLIIDKKTRYKHAITDLSDTTLRIYDDKKLTLNLCENNEYRTHKNYRSSKNISHNEYRKSVSINNLKIYANKPKNRKIFIFEKPEFF
jgi:hypothetical protein